MIDFKILFATVLVNLLIACNQKAEMPETIFNKKDIDINITDISPCGVDSINEKAVAYYFCATAIISNATNDTVILYRYQDDKYIVCDYEIFVINHKNKIQAREYKTDLILEGLTPIAPKNQIFHRTFFVLDKSDVPFKELYIKLKGFFYFNKPIPFDDSLKVAQEDRLYPRLYKPNYEFVIRPLGNTYMIYRTDNRLDTIYKALYIKNSM